MHERQGSDRSVLIEVPESARAPGSGSKPVQLRVVSQAARGISRVQVGIFAAAPLSAPIAGRLADRGWTRSATGWALVAAVFAFMLAAEARLIHSLWLLVLAAVILDAAVQACQVLSLRTIYMLSPELRGRLNGLFIAFAFLCGAGGSGLAAALYTSRGWTTVAALGALCAAAALAQYATELRPINRRLLRSDFN